MNEDGLKKTSKKLSYGVVVVMLLAVIDVILSTAIPSFSNAGGIIWVVLLAILLVYLLASILVMSHLKKRLNKEKITEPKHG